MVADATLSALSINVHAEWGAFKSLAADKTVVRYEWDQLMIIMSMIFSIKTVTSAIGLFASTELPLQHDILHPILQMLYDPNPGVRGSSYCCIEFEYLKRQLAIVIRRHRNTEAGEGSLLSFNDFIGSGLEPLEACKALEVTYSLYYVFVS
ncbi:hypothetical protein Tco_0905935 [Tanacetum coccineum]